jgi:hypothetical protein
MFINTEYIYIVLFVLDTHTFVSSLASLSSFQYFSCYYSSACDQPIGFRLLSIDFITK